MTRSRQAMLAAARELLLTEGPAAVTHQRVARQAGVGRATAYRHWPRVDELLLDAMAQVDLPFFREPVTPVRPWLRRELRVAADEMALPPVAAVALAMMQGSAGGLPAEVRDRFTATTTGRIRAAIVLAAAEGELDAPVDPQDAVALLVGPILQRTCMQGGTVTDGLIDRIIDSIGTWHSLPADTGRNRIALPRWQRFSAPTGGLLRGEDVDGLDVRVLGQQVGGVLAEGGGDRAVQVGLPPVLAGERVENAVGGVAELERVPGDRAGLGKGQWLGLGQEGAEFLGLARLGFQDD
jgi:AcrR family transcriptional regulator